jgi:hypothetical protein
MWVVRPYKGKGDVRCASVSFGYAREKPPTGPLWGVGGGDADVGDVVALF